ncbi:hypothetical protein FOZ62_025031 [Perkinsus olseni]|uniref:EF-hand domain-containing protein n=1 Tax=Perkinsus olseni TaxID=32597 RepID=A0A7J6R537_PEROL|nr:hypothetical protein FOZ62_025031 [Perkinsus olseni]
MRRARSRSMTPTSSSRANSSSRPSIVTPSNGSILRWASLTANEQEQLARILDNHGIQFRKIMARGGHVHNVAYLRILCDDHERPSSSSSTVVAGKQPLLSEGEDSSAARRQAPRPLQWDEGISTLTVSGTVSEYPEQQQHSLVSEKDGDWQEALSQLRSVYISVFEALGDTGHDRRHPPAIFSTDTETGASGGKLHRTMEAFYADRSVKDATVHAAKALQSTGQQQTSVASIFVHWLTGRLGLRRLTGQGMMETLLLVHRSREADMMADIFARLLEGSYDATDLLFFLYVRSIVSTNVQVDKSPKAAHRHHHHHQPIIVQLPLNDIKALAKKVFGRDQKTIYDTFIHVLTDEITKAGGGDGAAAVGQHHHHHTEDQEQQPLVEVGYFMYIALWVYHHQRPEVMMATGHPPQGAVEHGVKAPTDATTRDLLHGSQESEVANTTHKDNAAAAAPVLYDDDNCVSPSVVEQTSVAPPAAVVYISLAALYSARFDRYSGFTVKHGRLRAINVEWPQADLGHHCRPVVELPWVVVDMIHACQRSMMDSVQEARQSSRHPLRLPHRDFDAALEPCVQTVLREECTRLVGRVEPIINDIHLPPASGPLVADALTAVATRMTTTADELVQIIMDGSVDDWGTSLGSLLLSQSKHQQQQQAIDRERLLNADIPVYQRLVQLRDSILADESGALRQSAVRDFCETLLSSSVLEAYCAQLMTQDPVSPSLVRPEIILPPSSLHNIEDMFKAQDKDGDGRIDAEELAEAWKAALKKGSQHR